jgi:hypothetical protein
MRHVTDGVRKFFILNNEIKSGGVPLWKLFAAEMATEKSIRESPGREPPTQAAVVAGTWQIRKIEPGAQPPPPRVDFAETAWEKDPSAHTHTRTHANSDLPFPWVHA